MYLLYMYFHYHQVDYVLSMLSVNAKYLYFHDMQNIAQHLLFARSTNNYLVFLAALYFSNAFYFHKVIKSFNDLSCIHIVKTIKDGI